MAILSNINGKFAVEDNGAIKFNNLTGTDNQVLIANTNSSPTWVDVSTIIGGPYLPLTGGDLAGDGNLLVGGTLTVNGVTTLNDHLKVFNAWSSSDLTQNSFYAQNATDGFAFGVGTDVSTWFSYDSTTGIGVKPAIHVYNNASEIKIGVSDQPITMVGVTTFNANIAGTTGSFSGLVSGITPTAAANFATKAYVDAIDHGVTQITAGTNVTITPVSGTGNVTINANTQGDITALTLGNGLTGTNLTGPIPDILMSGTYTGTFNITDDLNVTDSARFEGTTNPITIGDGFGYGGSATICKHNADIYLQYNNGQTATNLQIGGGGTAVTIKDAQNGGFQITGNSTTYFTGGNVGISTTIPQSILSLSKTNESSYTPATAVDYSLMLGTRNGNAAGTSDDLGPGIVWKYNDSGGSYTKKSAGIMQVGEGNYLRSGLAFYTNDNADQTTAWSEKMRLSMDGNVGIGTASPAVRLDFGSATGKAFHLYTSGTDYYGFNMLQYDSGPFSTNIFSGNGGEIKLRTVTGSSTAVTRLTVKAAGNVGIGTTTPDAKLEVEGDVNSGFFSVFAKNTNAGSNAYVSKKWLNNDAAFGEIWRNSSTRSSTGQSPLSFNMYNSHDINFWSGGTHTMELTGSNVGINRISPATTLHVQTTAVPGVSHAYYGSLIVENSGESAIDIVGTSYSSIYFGDAASPYAGGIVYNHSLNALDFRVNTNTNAMWIDSGGDVGIGVTGNVGYKLDVNGTGNFSSYLKLANAWSSSTLSANSFYVQNATDGFAMGVGTGISSWFSWDNSAGQKRAIDVYNNGSSILVGAGGQKVQIQGTTVPLAPLSVDNNAIRMGRDWAIANRADIRLDSNGPSNPADILYGHTAAANQGSWTGVYWALSSRGSSASNRFYFYRGGGNPTGGSEAVLMTLDPNLRVGINQEAPAYALDVTGVIRATSDILAYSDARVKNNVKTIDNALKKVTKLRGVSYTRNDIEDKSTKIGVIAQEVLKVLPEVVSKDDEGKYSVSYGNIVGVLLEAIKELEARVKELENK